MRWSSHTEIQLSPLRQLWWQACSQHATSNTPARRPKTGTVCGSSLLCSTRPGLEAPSSIDGWCICMVAVRCVNKRSRRRCGLHCSCRRLQLHWCLPMSCVAQHPHTVQRAAWPGYLRLHADSSSVHLRMGCVAQHAHRMQRAAWLNCSGPHTGMGCGGLVCVDGRRLCLAHGCIREEAVVSPTLLLTWALAASVRCRDWLARCCA